MYSEWAVVGTGVYRPTRNERASAAGEKLSLPGDDPMKLGWKDILPPLDCYCIRKTDSGVRAPGTEGVPGVERGRTRGCTVSGWAVVRFVHSRSPGGECLTNENGGK